MSTDVGVYRAMVSVFFDDYAETPVQPGQDWNLYSFHSRDGNRIDSYSFLRRVAGRIEPAQDDVRKKLDAGLMFILSRYEHSGISWSLTGEGVRCRFDTSDPGGLLIWEGKEEDLGPTSLEGREEDARKFLDIYNAWINGECYGFSVEYPDGREDSCCGYIGADDLISAMRACHPDLFESAYSNRLKLDVELLGDDSGSLEYGQ